MIAESETVVIEKEMALTHAGFWRAVEKGLGTDRYKKTASGVVVEEGAKRLELTLGPERERRIALLVIEIMTVTLQFSGYSDEEREGAMVRFDRSFQRGGG